MKTKAKLSMDAAELVPVRSQRSVAKGPGTPLNFRIDPEFDREFRHFAVEHRMKLSEVLVKAFAALKREMGE